MHSGSDHSRGSAAAVEIVVPPVDRHSAASAHTYMLRCTSLVVLTLQNALLILVMRYARTRPGELFFSTTAVVVAELLKTIGCLLIILWQEGSFRQCLQHLNQNIVQQPMDCLKISVPAIIYVLQNNLLYVAVSNLDASTYQVSYQLKILTTALFSVALLHKRLSQLQWVSLVCLFTGVAVVQLQPQDTAVSTKAATQQQSAMIGLCAVGVASVMSGFAGVYFEKLLKHTSPSIFLRNVQLGVIGVVVGLITVYTNDGQQVMLKGFFHGYDGVVWLIVFLQAFSGLVVAVVVKYADNILKGFATSAAIIISCLASMYFFDFVVSLQFVVGASLVILATYMYSKYVPTVGLPFTMAKSDV
jgi:UDP-sugar transporter A1/2/3